MKFIPWPRKDEVEWKTAICWGQDKILASVPATYEQSSQSYFSDVIGQQLVNADMPCVRCGTHLTLMPCLLCAIIFYIQLLHIWNIASQIFFWNVGNFFAVVTMQDTLSMFWCIIETCTVNTNLSESETLELVCEESVLFLPVRPPGHWLC